MGRNYFLFRLLTSPVFSSVIVLFFRPRDALGFGSLKPCSRQGHKLPPYGPSVGAPAPLKETQAVICSCMENLDPEQRLCGQLFSNPVEEDPPGP